MTAEPLNVSLAGNQLLQKFLASRVTKEREMAIASIDEIYTGYVTGLDADWIQITRTKDLEAVLVRLSNVTSFQETGGTLKDHPGDIQRKIRDFGAVFSKISQREINKP